MTYIFGCVTAHVLLDRGECLLLPDTHQQRVQFRLSGLAQAQEQDVRPGCLLLLVDVQED